MINRLAASRTMQRRIAAMLLSRMALSDKSPRDIDDACGFRPSTAARNIARMVKGTAGSMNMTRLADMFFAVGVEIRMTIQPFANTETEKKPYD